MGEKGRDWKKHQWERDTSANCLPHVPRPGVKPATEIHALDLNGTWDSSVHRASNLTTEQIGEDQFLILWLMLLTIFIMESWLSIFAGMPKWEEGHWLFYLWVFNCGCLSMKTSSLEFLLLELVLHLTRLLSKWHCDLKTS